MTEGLRERILAIWPLLSALGVEHLDVFGSEARSEAQPPVCDLG